MLGRGVAEAHSVMGTPWEDTFAAIQSELSQADIRMGNLESPITENTLLKSTYDLRAPTESVTAIKSAGVSYLCFNNNHSLDAGQAGVEDTIKTLSAVGIQTLPPNNPMKVLQIKGRSIEIFCLDDTSESASSFDLISYLNSIPKKTDYRIVYIHWGNEYQSGPSDHQRHLARDMAESGVDIIIGSHPHVLQPIEQITRSDGRTSLVAYSLGNAIFDQEMLPATTQSTILIVSLNPDGNISLEDVPFSFDVQTGLITRASPRDREAISNVLHLTLPPLTDAAK